MQYRGPLSRASRRTRGRRSARLHRCTATSDDLKRWEYQRNTVPPEANTDLSRSRATRLVVAGRPPWGNQMRPLCVRTLNWEKSRECTGQPTLNWRTVAWEALVTQTPPSHRGNPALGQDWVQNVYEAWPHSEYPNDQGESARESRLDDDDQNLSGASEWDCDKMT